MRGAESKTDEKGDSGGEHGLPSLLRTLQDPGDESMRRIPKIPNLRFL